MKKFKKYEFESEEQAKQYIDALGENNNDIVELGFLVIEQGTYDDDGNVITPPTMSDKYSVDVIWHDKKDKDWKDFRIKLNGKQNSHSFMGWNYSDSTV